MGNLGISIGVILFILVLMFFVTAVAWWIVLWSFNFPIAFAFKQVIGVYVLMLLFNSSQISN